MKTRWAFADRRNLWPREILYLGARGGFRFFGWPSMGGRRPRGLGYCYVWAQSAKLTDDRDPDAIARRARSALRAFGAPRPASLGTSESDMQGEDYVHLETTDAALLAWMLRAFASSAAKARGADATRALREERAAEERRAAEAVRLADARTPALLARVDRYRKRVPNIIDFTRRDVVKLAAGDFHGVPVVLFGIHGKKGLYTCGPRFGFDSPTHFVERLLDRAGPALRAEFVAFCQALLRAATKLRRGTLTGGGTTREFFMGASPDVLAFIERRTKRH